MCGIVGYLGKKNAVPFLSEGLKRLEYRGYDSAGIAIHAGEQLNIIKRKGKLSNLEQELDSAPETHLGIGHNRWATHGEPSDTNSHPHFSQDKKIAIVHNGIIENFVDLKENLIKKGYTFRSDTDSEVIAYLLEDCLNNEPSLSLVDAIQKVIPLLSGTYGILVIHSDHPDTLVGIRNGSPLCFGLANDALMISSDVVAFATNVNKVVHLEDRELVVFEKENYRTINFKGKIINKRLEKIDVEKNIVSKGEFDHFMLKEIFEQPESIMRAISGRMLEEVGNAKLGGINIPVRDLLDIEHVCFVGCGTSYHVGLLGVYLVETLARIPSSAEIAPELKYRNPIVRKNTLYIGISQSGETVDTNSTLQEIINKGGKAIGVCNVVGSSMARLLGAGVYVHAGVEVSVCSTKAFTSQISAIYLLAILLARSRDLSQHEGTRLIRGLQDIPGKITQILKKTDSVKKIAQKYAKYHMFLFMGRGVNYAVALEGALKLKEVAYVFAEGYSSSEMKHGAIALIDSECASIFICPNDDLKSKNISNIQEVRSRNGSVLVIATEGDKETAAIADDVLFIPETEPELVPYLSVAYLQLFSYYVALELGKDIDQPRNLAKSVTVE